MRLTLLLFALTAAPSWASYLTTISFDVTLQSIAQAAKYQDSGFVFYYPVFEVRLPFFWAPTTDIRNVSGAFVTETCAGWQSNMYCDNAAIATYSTALSLPGHYFTTIASDYPYHYFGEASTTSVVTTTTPEPGSWLMLAIGLGALLLYAGRDRLRALRQ